MSTSYKQAEAAQEKLFKLFNFAAGKDSGIVTGAGLSEENGSWYVKVNLEREPSAQEAKKLPKKYNGVAVKYEVVGTVRAAL